MSENKIVVAVVGVGGVGKSSCTLRFLKNIFHDQYDPTVEETYTTQRTINGKEYKVEIIDTAGQDDYETFRKASISYASGFFCVYAITSRDSFERAESLLGEVAEQGPVILLGNKEDLSDSRQVETGEGEKLAAEYKAKFIEVSAKTGDHVAEAFEQLFALTVDSENKKAKAAATSTGSPKAEGDGCCAVQ
eukprot:m.23374 g.23374  ORF g.23374 m.23374 type:complete len:191 (-) comp11371_c0_seq1:94-666(-)